MALPNFLGVGFFRCGTTWLHDLLDSHPDCYMPQAFKEVHFFADKHFPRGQAWYESFFPVDAEKFKAIGEIGPRYAKPGQVERCLERIATFPSLAEDGRFLFIIRNHVDRAYSGYKQASASRGALSFDDYRREHEAEKGPLIQPFAPTIDAYRQRFGPERVLVVRLEDAYGNPASTRGRVADFLGLDPTRFPSDAGGAAANASEAAMRGPVYLAAARVNVWLIRNGMHHLSGRLRRLGLQRVLRVFSSNKPTEYGSMSATAIAELSAEAEPDRQHLETMLGINLDDWRTRNSERANQPTPPTASNTSTPPTPTLPSHA